MVRRAASSRPWHWVTASSAAGDLRQAVYECAQQLEEQRPGGGTCDLLMVHVSGHRSTRGLRSLFTEAGTPSRHFFGSATRFGPIESRLAAGPALVAAPSPEAIAAGAEEGPEALSCGTGATADGSDECGARLTATACVLPGVEVTPFHCAEEGLPDMGEGFAWERQQQPHPEEGCSGRASRASLMLLQVNRFCFDEERWLRKLDGAFPFAAKVGHAFGSRTGEAERRMARADAHDASDALDGKESSGQEWGGGKEGQRIPLSAAVRQVDAAHARMKREVMFVDDDRHFSGASGVLLSGNFDVSCFPASSFVRLGGPLTITELFLGGVFSLNETFVWSALNSHLEKHGIGLDRDSVFVAVIRDQNRVRTVGGLDPSPDPYKKIVYRSVDWGTHETAMFLEDEELAIGDQLQLFRCDLVKGAADMRSQLSSFAASPRGREQLRLLCKGQGGSLAFTSILTPDITNYFCRSNYRQLLDTRMEDLDEELAREQSRAQHTAMLAAGMTQHVEDESENDQSGDDDQDTGDSPHMVVIRPGDDSSEGMLLVDASQLQEETFPQRMAAARREARAKEILAGLADKVDGSDVEVAEDEKLFLTSSEDEALDLRLEESLKSLSTEDAVEIMADRPSELPSEVDVAEQAAHETYTVEDMQPLSMAVEECSDTQLVTGSYGLSCILPTRKKKRGSVATLALLHSSVVVVITPSAFKRTNSKRLSSLKS